MLHSLHSWLGLLSVVLTVLQLVLGEGPPAPCYMSGASPCRPPPPGVPLCEQTWLLLPAPAHLLRTGPGHQVITQQHYRSSDQASHTALAAHIILLNSQVSSFFEGGGMVGGVLSKGNPSHNVPSIPWSSVFIPQSFVRPKEFCPSHRFVSILKSSVHLAENLSCLQAV